MAAWMVMGGDKGGGILKAQRFDNISRVNQASICRSSEEKFGFNQIQLRPEACNPKLFYVLSDRLLKAEIGFPAGINSHKPPNALSTCQAEARNIGQPEPAFVQTSQMCPSAESRLAPMLNLGKLKFFILEEA